MKLCSQNIKIRVGKYPSEVVCTGVHLENLENSKEYVPMNLTKKMYDICILSVNIFGPENLTLTQYSLHQRQSTQRAIKREMLMSV